MPLIPLAAALAFPFAALALKRALACTRDLWGVIFICNAVLALAFLPFLFKTADSVPAPQGWQPMLAGLFFFLGQIAAFKSFQGDLSIAIPVQGAKVLLVAFLAMFVLGQGIDTRIWAASGLSVAALHFLHDESGKNGEAKSVWHTLLYACFAAFAFAAFDISVQKWAPHWGPQRFGPWAFLSQASLSFCLLLAPHQDRFRYGGGGWAWLLSGALGMAVITVALVFAIGAFGKATEVNLLFNSRCLWGVVAIWMLGKKFGNLEAGCGRRTMAHRLGGAGLMMAAVFIELF